MSVTREEKPTIIVTRTELVLPSMTNSHGTMFGGKVLEMMDMTGGIAAMKFCRLPVVTASSEHVDFRIPIRASSVVELNASVVFTGNSSMAVKVTVYSQHPAEEEKHLCTTGYFTFVALDPTSRKTVPVPKLLIVTDEQQADWDKADSLREFRKKR
jgi:acyl-CoA hydrolase